MLLGTPCATRINYRRHHLLLTDGPHRAETAGCARVRDHYGATTEGPRCPVMSTPTSSTTPAVAPLEKARPLRTTAATTTTI
jgi:hypothetical protein